MTIVEQFIDQNEQLLDQLTAENPSLGGAIAEALAVIDFYAKSNKVEFDDKRKEELLASPVAEVVEIKQEPQMKEVLKKIDEVVAENQPSVSEPTPTETTDEMKWVVETSDLSYASAILNVLEKAGNPASYREANGTYYVIADNKMEISLKALNVVNKLILTQRQLLMSEIDRITQQPAAIAVAPEITPPSAETTMPTTPETHTATAPIVHESKEFVEDDILVSQEDLDALKQLEDLDITDIDLEDLDI